MSPKPGAARRMENRKIASLCAHAQGILACDLLCHSNSPFRAAFDATNMVAGQSVYITMHVAQFPNSPGAATITLLPQTLDGMITEISNTSGFTVYTIMLADYDPLVMLSAQQGQTTLLQNPRTVVVYADANTQILSTATPSLGSVLRFNGLVFNDNGTLRMDCSEVLDGVTL
jgi:hypothetical protein